MTEKEIREQAWADGYEYGKSVATINMPRLIKEAEEQERERIITKLDKCFKLAPYDNDYLRLLVEDVVGELKTGKNAKQRQDEKWQALQGS